MTSEDIARWKRQVREISDWLYERDPPGATGGGSSPDDEYDGEAVRVLSGVQDATTPEECIQVVRDVFDKAFNMPWTPSPEAAQWLMQYTRSASREQARHPCPCCGYLTYIGPPPDDDDDPNAWCPVCGWISNGLQNTQPKASGMPNVVSLEQSRANFAQHGAANPGDDRVRLPSVSELPG